MLVAKELEHELGADSRYREDLQLLHTQAKRCREILQKLTRSPDDQDPMHASITIQELLDEASIAHRGRGKQIVVSAHPITKVSAMCRDQAQAEDVLYSLHLKATMMKVSDPIIFGHVVRAFLPEVFERYGADRYVEIYSEAYAAVNV